MLRSSNIRKCHMLYDCHVRHAISSDLQDGHDNSWDAEAVAAIIGECAARRGVSKVRHDTVDMLSVIIIIIIQDSDV